MQLMIIKVLKWVFGKLHSVPWSYPLCLVKDSKVADLGFMHHISISSLIRRGIVWVPFIWVVMYGSIFPLRLGKWELWEHDWIHCRSREVILGAVSRTHVWCARKQYRMLGDSILRGDVVTRAMMWVVTCHMHGCGVYVCGCIALNSCSACSYCGRAEMSFLQVR